MLRFLFVHFLGFPRIGELLLAAHKFLSHFLHDQAVLLQLLVVVGLGCESVQLV
jgi:hypothetical protein